MSDMSSSQEVLFLMNVNGESRWIKIGYEKIWIHLFWKIFTDGKYVGEFKDGKQNGQGTYTYPDGQKYVGRWKDGKDNGQGTFTYPDGQKYVGRWKDDKRNGQGTRTWSDGSKVVGEFKDGILWNGKMYYKDGKIIGKWVNGKLKVK